MNPASILSLISDLYSQVAQLGQQLADVTAERDALRAHQAAAPPPAIVDGDVRVYRLADDFFVVADRGGWVDGSFSSADEALAAVHTVRAGA